MEKINIDVLGGKMPVDVAFDKINELVVASNNQEQAIRYLAESLANPDLMQSFPEALNYVNQILANKE